MNRIICGVDVAQNWLDAHVWPTGVIGRFGNDADGIAELAAWCRRHDVEMVAMEASGGYEQLPYLLLSELGQPCAPPLNARNVRSFAVGIGIIEKTDRLDAKAIAHFAETRKISPVPPPSSMQRRLKALVSRLSQVTGDLTIQKQRRAAASSSEVLGSIDEVIALLKRQQRSLSGEIASMIDDDPLWATLNETFRSMKGIAGRTVAMLLATVPEIGLLPNKAIAKMVGVAPIANDSGKRKGRRPVRGGRADPRNILFVVARIAAKYDPHLMAFHDRLQKAGKEKMVIRIALARKVLVILNAKARDARIQFANAT